MSETAEIVIKEVSQKATKKGVQYYSAKTESGVIYNIPKEVAEINPGDKLTVTFKMVEYEATIAGVKKMVKSRWVESVGGMPTPSTLEEIKKNYASTGQKFSPEVAVKIAEISIAHGTDEDVVIEGVIRILGRLNK